MEELSLRKREVDKELQTHAPLRDFNWGAFFLTWIWAIGNRSFNTVTLLHLVFCAVPYVGPFSAISLMLYSGLTGNDRAWNAKEWQDSEHFKRVQRRWALVGVTQFAIAVLLVAGTPFFFVKTK